MWIQRIDAIPWHPWALVAVIAMTLLGIVLPKGAAAGEAAPPFAPGEVLIKFRSGTDASSAVSRSGQKVPPSLEELAPTSRLLSEKTGIPLRAKQLLSGDWVVFAVDVDALGAQASAQLKKQDDVTDVDLKAAQGEGINQPNTPDLEVVFRPGSSAAKVIEAAATNERLSALVEDLGRRLGLPFSGTVQAKRLRLQIDLQKLTALLAERLGSFSDIVESAQLNYIMRAM